jgi:hypothetical protein
MKMKLTSITCDDRGTYRVAVDYKKTVGILLRTVTVPRIFISIDRIVGEDIPMWRWVEMPNFSMVGIESVQLDRWALAHECGMLEYQAVTIAANDAPADVIRKLAEIGHVVAYVEGELEY